jgi:hypothetical protein
MGMLTVVVPSAGDTWVVDVSLTLLTSKPGSPTHLRCPLQEFIMEDAVSQPVQTSGFGTGEVREVIALEVREDR